MNRLDFDTGDLWWVPVALVVVGVVAAWVGILALSLVVSPCW